MKKLILALLFLLLSCSISFAENQQLAWMGPVIAGAASPASCSSSIDSGSSGVSANFNNATRYYAAFSFTASSSYTLYHAAIWLRRWGTGGGGNLALYICTNNATPDPDNPSTTCQAADEVIAVSSINTGGGDKTFDFSSGYEISASTRYWYLLVPDTTGDANNYLIIGYNGTGSEVVLYSTDTVPTWASQDYSALGSFINSSCQ